MQANPIVIVGGGAAGLSTAGALKKTGLTALVLDQDSSVGSSWLRRPDALKLQSDRRFSGLAYCSIPTQYPRYLTRDMYAEYLQLYARRFGINVVHNCKVENIRLEGFCETGEPRFALETTQGQLNARMVVVATGLYNEPVLPEFPQLHEFQGRAVHSSAYKNGREYAGKRVLVVGIGNAGAEIATDLAEAGAAFVGISTRSTPTILPRDFLGTPVQILEIALCHIPARLADGIDSLVARVALGDLTRYGLQRAAWLPFSTKRIPVIDVGLVDKIKHGGVFIRPSIARFFRSGVVYADGRSEDFDAVIFATGFQTGLDKLLHVPAVLDGAGLPKVDREERTPQAGLYFIGFVKSQRCHLFQIEVDSRRLARTIALDLDYEAAS